MLLKFYSLITRNSKAEPSRRHGDHHGTRLGHVSGVDENEIRHGILSVTVGFPEWRRQRSYTRALTIDEAETPRARVLNGTRRHRRDSHGRRLRGSSFSTCSV
ncbi:hypothetical protein AB1N83_006625 [Pleurotus pulmonarius]